MNAVQRRDEKEAREGKKKITAPGEHLPAALIVRSLMAGGAPVDDEVVKSEQAFFEALDKELDKLQN